MSTKCCVYSPYFTLRSVDSVEHDHIARIELYRVNPAEHIGKNVDSAQAWHPQRGDRTLTGAEAVLIRETLVYVVDMVEEDITV